jgi:hypothetical protein
MCFSGRDHRGEKFIVMHCQDAKKTDDNVTSS